MKRWTRRQRAWLAQQARRVPSLCPEPAWMLEFAGRAIELFERTGHERHDSAGLDRLLTCGMVLAELVHAVQDMGWQCEVELDPDPLRPDMVARLDPYPAATPRIPERLRAARLELVADRQQTAVLARVLLDAGRQLDGDRRCAEELAPWQESSVRALVPAGARPLVEPYADAVCAIAARLLSRPVIVVVTGGDERRDHVLAGAAIRLADREVRQQGMTLHPVIRPMHLRQIRLRLMSELQLDGVPQALLGVEPAEEH